MRNVNLIVIIFLLSALCFAQPRKTDRELLGLKGNVQTVKSEFYSITFDHHGNKIQESSSGGNCTITDTFTYENADKRKVKISRKINDGSSSAICTFIYQDLLDKNQTFTMDVEYGLNYSHFVSPSNFEFQAYERAIVGKSLFWSKIKFFDNKGRIVKSLFVDRSLRPVVLLYEYVGDESEPVAIENYENTILSHKRWYKYGSYDANGNWTKKENIKTEPKDFNLLSDETRKITYFPETQTPKENPKN